MCLNSVLSSVITTLVIDRDHVTKDPESSIWNASPVFLKGSGACLLIPNGSRPREIREMFITNVKCKTRLADSIVNQSQSQGKSQLCHCL